MRVNRQLENRMILNLDFDELFKPHKKERERSTTYCAICGQAIPDGDEAFEIEACGETYCSECCKPVLIGGE